MPVSFLHCSDIHLGFSQFHRDERFHDFGSAFRQIVDYAVEHEVDFVLVAGDLFNKRSINSRTLSQVMDELKRLSEAGIAAVAVEGNHDKAPYGDGDSWMRFLNAQGFLKLLVPRFSDGRLVLNPWRSPEDVGSVLETASLRLVGLPYQGVMTEKRITQLADELQAVSQPTVLMLHSAVDRLMHLGGISFSTLEPLQDRVQYVAMGHVHTRYELNNWVYNPGAPECWDLAETAGEKGFYHVTMIDERCYAEYVPSERRPVVRQTIEMADSRSPEEVYELCRRTFSQLGGEFSRSPLVSIVLAGTARFNPLLVDSHEVENVVRETMDCLHVEVVNQGSLEARTSAAKGQTLSDREHLERQVLAGLFQEEGVSDPSSVTHLVDLVGHLKALLQTEFDEEALADVVENAAERLVRRTDGGQE